MGGVLLGTNGMGRRGPMGVMAAALLALGPGIASAQTAAPWPGPLPPPAEPPLVEQARRLEQLRLGAASPGGGTAEASSGADLRRRYLRQAHALLHRYWSEQAASQAQPQTGAQPRSIEKPRLLFAGDRASGCGVGLVQHPMAFYCPQSREIAMAMNLRQSVRSARALGERELLSLDLAVLAHEWGHHVNRSLGLGPYRGGLGLTVKQEELAADWRTGIALGWLLANGAMTLDDFTRSANLMFELGDYERINPSHHGYPKDRFDAFTAGIATQLRPGQQLGAWTVDTRETFSRVLTTEPRVYEVRRFEIDRSNQVATNLIGGLLGAASCVWGSTDQCLGMAAQQGKGRAYGRYTTRRLQLDCTSGRFDVSDDQFGPQPLERDGKGQAPVLAQRDCRAAGT